MNENLRIVLSLDAREDIFEAIQWYEENRKGLGFEADEEILQKIKAVGKNPFLYHKVYGRARAAHLKRFPLTVWFWIDENNGQVNIFGVLPQAGDPDKLKRRAFR